MLSREQLIWQLQQLAQELGHVPTVKEYDRCSYTAVHNTVYKYFDSWNEFLRMAGLEVALKGSEIEDDLLLEQVRTLAAELGHTPTTLEYNKCSYTAHYTVVCNRFGSWERFLRTAGLEVARKNRSRGINADALIAQLQQLAQELGHVPSVTEFDACKYTVSHFAVYSHFEGWQQFLTAAQLGPLEKKNREYTADLLIAQAQKLAKELKHVPTAEEFDAAESTLNQVVVDNCFGSWKQLLLAACLETDEGLEEYTLETLLEQKKALTEKLGRMPTAKEFNELSSTAAACRLSGGWGHFLERKLQ